VLNIHLRGKPILNIDTEALARQTPGFSGADLANLVNEAALHAARSSSKLIKMEHFAEAWDKIVLGTERPLLMKEEDRRIIAYHEAGHALVALLLPETDPVNKITIIPRGQSLGVTQYLPEGDPINVSRQYLLSQLATALGGRAAEHVAIGEITTGAAGDLQHATRTARRMIGSWGMSEELGLLFADENQNNPFLGREMAGPRNHSEATAAKIDEAVRNLLHERMETATRVLRENYDALERLAEALLKHETLDRNGILAAVRGDDVPPPDAEQQPSQDEPLRDAEGKPIPHPRPGVMPA
jgi:cell division protease FtsH